LERFFCNRQKRRLQMTNIPNRDFQPNERRTDFERPPATPAVSSSMVWIILAAAVIVILGIGLYSMNQNPLPVAATSEHAAPGAVAPAALPTPAAPATPAP
jgi:hypothetical protein